MNADTLQSCSKLGTDVLVEDKSEQMESQEALEEFRKPWVDSPQPSYFTNHRNLMICARELKVMKLALGDYACNEEENDPLASKAVYNYLTQAHSGFLKALCKWIQDANERLEHNISVPALPRVQKLLTDYDPSISDKLLS